MSENTPPPGQPGCGKILEASRGASRDTPRLVELAPKDVAHQFVLEGRVADEPSPELVAKMMLQLEIEEEEFDPDVEPGDA